MDKDKNKSQKLNLFEKIEDIINNYCESSETPENNGIEDPKDKDPQPTNSDKKININNKLKELEKYNIHKDKWTIKYPFDVLRNYIQMRTKLCYYAGLIYYYKRDERDKYTEAIKPRGPYCPNEPEEDAEKAILNLDINTKDNGKLFCIFEKKKNDKNFHFEKFCASNDSDLQKEMQRVQNEKITPDKFDIIENFDKSILDKRDKRVDFTKTPIDINHIIKNMNYVPEANNEKRIERFLPKNIRDFFDTNKTDEHNQAKCDLIKSIIGLNMRLIKKETHVFSWPIEDMIKNSQPDLYCRNILFPLYFPWEEKEDDICAAMVFRVFKSKGDTSPLSTRLSTIFDLKQAFMGAKLYDPNFESKWLTIENVKRAMKKGCVQEK